MEQEARRASLRLLQGTALPLVNRALAQADLSVAAAGARKRSPAASAGHTTQPSCSSRRRRTTDSDSPKVAMELAGCAAVRGGEAPCKAQLRSRLTDAAVLGRSPAALLRACRRSPPLLAGGQR